ncbi:MAG TPA: DUF2339 domain-containing protein [Burkholderiales bacterium]|nr:DUF2339 domain-containing protein [Burkholderiales bacterium]
MWFLGLIIGAIVGAIGGVGGAVVGAIVGLAVGLSLSKKQPVIEDTWKLNVEDALRQLHQRVETIERRAGATPAREESGPQPATAAVSGSFVEPTPAPETVVETPVTAIAGSEATPAETYPAHEAGSQTTTAAPAKTPPDNPFSRWLFGGNTLVRVGVIVLFFGVAFLLKYAAERDLVPIELRLVGVALGGIALLIVGWRLRTKRPGYALVLQGGGVGVLYLTIFAAFRLYKMLPPELAFGLLAGIAAFSAVLAVLQDSRSLAITGAAGGFLAPILASTGGGNHVALFGFYAVLNAGILGIAYYKAWRELNLVGFAFTFIIGLLWGSKYYRPELFSSTEPFLVLFFLFYVAIAVLFASRRAPQLTHYVDGTLVFGTPLVAFGLQAALVRDMEFGSAWSAFALAAFYIAIASLLYARRRDTLRLLVESFLALGVGFATLSVPLAFDGRWTSAVWAVEGAAIVWVGVRQGRTLARVFGMLLQPAAGFAFLAGVDRSYDVTPALNSFYLGCVMVSLAGLFCNRYLESRRDAIKEAELIAARLLFVWGALWWFGAGIVEIHRHAPAAWGAHPYLLFFAGSCAAFGALWRKLDWGLARYAALAMLPLMVLVLFASMDRLYLQRHPFAHHAYLGWTLAFWVHLSLLRAHDERNEGWIDWFHAAGFWLLAVVLSWEVGWQIDHYVEGRRVWPLISWALVPGTLLAVFAARGDRLGWPVSARRHAYLYAGALPLVIFLLAWVVFVNFRSDGNPAPLPYLPLLNPLDLAQAGALLALVTWYLGVRRLQLPEAKLPGPTLGIKVLGVVLFIALNGVMLRTLHHYADVPFRIHAMWSSNLVQASFSLFWSLLALAAMVTATRRGLRALWMVGAVLLGVVVAKLFLVDLANTGTVERVISFISVGVLVIVVGYFSPVPPKSLEKSA